LEGISLISIVFCIPTYERPFRECLDALEGSLPFLGGIEHQTVFEVGCPYISHARATMLRKAMLKKCDEVLFIDHDLSWKPEDLRKIIEIKGDVVAGLYRFKKDEIEYMGVLDTDPEGYAKVYPDGCLKGYRVPAGFLKISMGAVRKFMEAYPELIIKGEIDSPDLFNHGVIDGIWYGEDYAFSKRWTEKCGEIKIVPDLDLCHVGKERYEGNYHRFLLGT
jgi:hypothetical protein